MIDLFDLLVNDSIGVPLYKISFLMFLCQVKSAISWDILIKAKDGAQQDRVVGGSGQYIVKM